MDVIIDSVCDFTPLNGSPCATQGSLYCNLLASLGYEPDNLPVGDLLRRYHKLQGKWIVLSPMRWQASHNNAMIVEAGESLGLTEIESRFWFQKYADFLGEEGMIIFYHDAHTWLLRCDGAPALNAKSVYHMLNQPLMAELNTLDQTMHWQRFFTENQMFFASIAEASPINGLWAWGSADLHEQHSRSFCADSSLIALARLCASSDVATYDHSLALHHYEVLLLRNVEVLSDAHLHQLNNISARWYWNNSAYACNKPGWFTRLWRKLTHAH